MGLTENNQDSGSHFRRFLISETFLEIEYSQFREYCIASNIVFLDELQPYDYVAFRTQFKANAEFVRKVRLRSEEILSGKANITPGADYPKPITHDLKAEPAMQVSEKQETSWGDSIQATAETYKNTPLDGLELPNRVRHRLMSAGITTIGKMLLTTPNQFRSIGFIGSHSLDVIKAVSEDLVYRYTERSLLSVHLPCEEANQDNDSNQDFPEQKTEIFDEYPKPENDSSCYNWNIVLQAAAQDNINTPLDTLRLSNRAFHRLQRAGLDTVGKVLLASDEQLLSIRHLGNVLLLEIQEAKNKFVYDYCNQNISIQEIPKRLPIEIEQFVNPKITNGYIKTRNEIRLSIENILFENTQSEYEIALTSQEVLVLDKVKQAVEDLGIELCRLIYIDPRVTKYLIQAFQRIIEHQEISKTIQQLVLAIPESRRKKQLHPFIKLFNQIKKPVAEDDLSNIFCECNTIDDIRNNLCIIIEQKNQSRITKFLKWLSINILDSIKPILAETIGEGRLSQILIRRASGDTLETIGLEYDLTRERIRQIETKAFQTFKRYHRLHPFLLAISAELNGEAIITSNDIHRLTPDSEILLYLLKKRPDSGFVYDKYFDFFYLPSVINPDSALDFIFALPTYIYEAERTTFLNEICQNNKISSKLLEIAFNKRYQQMGKVWRAGKMNRASMYSFIIEKYFPNGIRLYESSDISRFRKYVHDLFGNVEVSENDRALWGTIQRICVLYDRGVYIHPSRISIPDDLVDRIEKYFIQSGRTSISFHELYDKFADELLVQANITNRYALQGVLKVHLGEKYILYKDGISTKEGYSITQEIETYIRKNSPVAKETILAAFSGITEAMLTQNIARLPSVILIENSTYMHSKRLKITIDDYKIKQIIQSQTEDYPVTASKILEVLYLVYPDFLIRNNIDSPNTLFGILQFMFSDEFSFSRPYISPLNTNGVSKRDIIISLLAGQQRVNISYLILLCEEHHVSFQNSTSMIRALQDGYLRVDEDTLVLITNIHVIEETLLEIKELLKSAICHKGYLTFKSIDSYIFYPDLGIPWTPFLLRSILDKYLPNDFKIIDNPTTQDIAFDVIVDPRLKIDNYEDLIRSVIRTEHHRDPFKDQTSVVKWLIDEALLTKKAAIVKGGSVPFSSPVVRLVYKHIPKFITEGGIMYTDEYGKLIIR